MSVSCIKSESYEPLKHDSLCIPTYNRTQSKKVKSFKCLGVHITDDLKWSSHTVSVVKAQQRLFNLRKLKKFDLAPKTLTNFPVAQLRASCQAVSPPGKATAPPATAGLSRGWYGLHNASPGANYLPSRTPTSQEGQKNHQGHQLPEPRPVHPATRS